MSSETDDNNAQTEGNQLDGHNSRRASVKSTQSFNSTTKKDKDQRPSSKVSISGSQKGVPQQTKTENSNPPVVPKSSQSKRESRAESVMSMTEEEAKAVLQDFLKSFKSRRPPTRLKNDANKEGPSEEKGSSERGDSHLPKLVEENDGQVDQLVERIVEKLKPYLNPEALEVIEEQEEDAEPVHASEVEDNSFKDELQRQDRAPSQRSIKTAEKVQSVLQEIEKLRDLIEVGRTLNAENGEGGVNQEKELTNVVLALKRKEAKLSQRLKEVEQREAEIQSRKEILEKKDEEVEKYVRELVENTNKNDEKRQQMDAKEAEINRRLEQAEKVTEKCRAQEEEMNERESIVKQQELDVKAHLADVERREKQIEIDKQNIADQKEKIKTMEEKVHRRERELKNEEQRLRDLESEIKMQDMDVKFRLEDAKRKEEEVKKRMEEVEDENEKLDRVMRKIQTEKRRLADDFRSKQDELTELSARARKFISDWNRRMGNQVSDEQIKMKLSMTDKSLASAISEVESERRMLELEAEIVEQQLELERKGRLLLEQDKYLAGLGHHPQSIGDNHLSRKKGDARLPPLGSKSPGQITERNRREEGSYGGQRVPPAAGNERVREDRRDSLRLESVKSDDGEEDSPNDSNRTKRSRLQPPFTFVFSLHNPGQTAQDVTFTTQPITTIRELKLALKKQEGIPVGWQKFYSNSRSLTDTTSLQRISGNTQLRLLIDRGNKPLKVITPDGSERKVSFDLEETIQFSKIRIFQATGLLPSQMKLFISGKEAKGNNLLGSFCKNGAPEIEVAYNDDYLFN
ncbi:hypothetical protein HOLleu_14599 [Holothuria leucospilota]|uniref:Ubiquitin-like domain-containing protein n=1 Tax=Holothuria leucospilota TaxID=206669 RepID=A0A9Q1C6Q3_HOLLE|nr:hypothetical protein HOLleu_14599 [Holothuria leucospilota]